MGLGSIGTLIAHSLMNLPNPPPITLLMHKPEMYEDYKGNFRLIRLVNKQTGVNDEQRGFDVDLYVPNERTGQPFWKFIPDTPDPKRPPTNPVTDEERLDTSELYIHTLIVAVKGPSTAAALRNVKHRVNARTTICLVQNGMGQIDELNEKVFTDPATRPTYMLGIISHGVHLKSNFVAIHAGSGTTALGIYRDKDKYPLPEKDAIPDPNLSETERRRFYPTEKDLYSNITSRYLLRQLTRSPVLCAAAFPYLDLVQLQLEKLTVNCVLNPLTAVFDVPNGVLLQDQHLNRIQHLLIAEISLVLRNLPELQAIPGVQARFSANRLDELVLGAADKTAANSSSMREDIRKLRKTEIDYINGYVVKRGEEQGIKCVLNYMMMQMVKAKHSIGQASEREAVPYSTSRVTGSFDEKTGQAILDDRGG